MAKETDEEVIASVNQVNAHMEGLQMEAEKKRRAHEKAVEKADSAKAEADEADKAVADYQGEHKKAAQKLMALMAKDPMKLQKLMAAGLKTVTSSGEASAPSHGPASGSRGCTEKSEKIVDFFLELKI